MTIKTTTKHLQIFEAECRRLHRLWGLTGWVLNVRHRNLQHGRVAEQSSSTIQRTLWVWLAKTWPVEAPAPTPAYLRETARHEMIHCLLEPLATLAECRWVTEDEVASANHEVLRRLMTLLPR